jgi:hypothetical protein
MKISPRLAERLIADLSRLAGELRRIASQCRGDGQIADCPIIEALFPGGIVTKQ